MTEVHNAPPSYRPSRRTGNLMAMACVMVVMTGLFALFWALTDAGEARTQLGHSSLILLLITSLLILWVLVSKRGDMRRAMRGP